MKQAYTLLMAVALSASAMSAQKLAINPEEFGKNSSPIAAPAFAGSATSMMFTYATSVAKPSYFEDIASGTEISQAYAITADILKLLDGSTLTAFNIYSPTSDKGNHMTKATVWLSFGLDEAPFYSKDVELSSVGGVMNNLAIDPVSLTGERTVFVGFTTEINSNDRYIYGDGMPRTGEPGSYIKLGTGSWGSYQDQLGSLAFGVTFSGNNLPSNGAAVTYVEMPDFFSTVSDQTVTLGLSNPLSGTVNNVEVEYTCGSAEPVTFTTNVQGTLGSIANCEGGSVSVPVKVPAGFDVDFSIRVTKVNGEPNTMAGINGFSTGLQTKVISIDPAKGYARNSVIEEGTGTWCGYCPGGMVLLDKLRNNVTDGSFIRIAVHNGDDMAVNAYQAFLKDYIPGFPMATVNRHDLYLLTDNFVYENIMTLYEACREARSPFSVEITDVVPNGNSFDVTAEVKAMDNYDNSAGRYQLSFVITEDGVGPYSQTNYYANSGVQMGGWENRTNPYRTKFDDVARRISDYPGNPNSLNGQLSPDTPFAYTASLSARNLSDNINFIVMLVDTETGYIINAAERAKLAGIDTVAAEASEEDAAAEYFTIQGIRVDNPRQGGLYIVRRGNTVTKQIIR